MPPRRELNKWPRECSSKSISREVTRGEETMAYLMQLMAQHRRWRGGQPAVYTNEAIRLIMTVMTYLRNVSGKWGEEEKEVSAQ